MARVYLGAALVYALFQWVAIATDSQYGEGGLLVGLVALLGTILAAVLLPASRDRGAAERVRALGLGRPRARGIAVAVALSVAMLGAYPLASALTGAPLTLREGWALSLPGLFAQGGIAEEVLFRGYLYGQLRHGRSFGRAVLLAAPPFVVAHLALFATLAPPIAGAALLLSVVISVPLARLFDLGGATIWAPAIAHFVVQSAPRLLTAEGLELELGLAWMGLAMLAPWLVFLVPVVPAERGERR